MSFNNLKYISRLGRIPLLKSCSFNAKGHTRLLSLQSTCRMYQVDEVKSAAAIAKENKATYSDLPVPQGSWQESYKERNEFYNKCLGASLAFFGLTSFIMYKRQVLTLNLLPDLKTVKVDAFQPLGRPVSESEEAAEAVVVTSETTVGATESETIPTSTEMVEEKAEVTPVNKPVEATFPSEIPYLIIGAGPAAMAASTSIRGHDAKSKVLVVGEEPHIPYSRYPLSKELWFTNNQEAVNSLQYTLSDGKASSIFFEKEQFFCKPEELNQKENGGVAVATGRKVVKLDVMDQVAHLDDGRKLKYGKCLIATGGKPRALPQLKKAPKEVMDRTTLFRTIEDFKKLDEITQKVKSVAIVGGGFLGSELACALGRRAYLRDDFRVFQVFPESGNMSQVLPEYLSKWCTDKIMIEGVDVIPNTKVVGCEYNTGQDKIQLNFEGGEKLAVDHVVCAVGLEPNVDLAKSSGLEIDEKLGGFLVNAELEARKNVWVAGDASCFYDVHLGRRRVEHHDHAEVSGRLAGKNMTGAGMPYRHQSMFWSVLGNDIVFQAVGVIDAKLPTISVFAKDTTPISASHSGDAPDVSNSDAAQSAETSSKDDATENIEVSSTDDALAQGDAAMLSKRTPQNNEEEYDKGVVFYLKKQRVVGVLMWNVFKKSYVARQIIKDQVHENDIASVAKLFELHGAAEKNKEKSESESS